MGIVMNFLEFIKGFLNKALAIIISILLTLMTSLVLWQVITRYLLNDPSTFTEELVIIILIWTSFLGAAYAFGTREHMSLIFLKEGLKGNKKITLCVLIDVIVLLFAVIILIYGGSQITQNVMAAKTPILKLSKGYIYVSTVVSGIIIMFFQLVNIAEDFSINDKKGEK